MREKHTAYPTQRATVAGVDEVGRGCLAGDVLAAAVILGDAPIQGLSDSKALTPEKRLELAEKIVIRASSWAIGRASVAEIDSLNILEASLMAMHRAVNALSIRPKLVLVDGKKLPNWPYTAKAIVGGDKWVAAISAASILAKVHRDQEMIGIDSKYPGYGFSAHKGYPTKRHLAALKRLGVSPIHRLSYAPVKRLLLYP